MRNIFLITAVVIGLFMVNCAGTPAKNPAKDPVQETQNEYNKIQKDTLVINNAPNELEKAREAVNDVKNSVGNGDKASLEQKITIARKRIAIAQKSAELRLAQDKVQHISDERRKFLNDIHKAKREQIEAGRADMPILERVKYLNNFRTLQTNRGLVLRFLDVTFNREKAYLTSNAEEPINELANFLSHYPRRNIRIEGYTDNTGSNSFNRQLSKQRADAVREALISRGIAESRIQSAGLGEQYPIASNKTDAGRKKNRRVEVVISDRSGEIPDRQ